MKSTGIVRKTDELGRIVLPKELRRTLDIADKDSLEIFTQGDCIVLRKYKRGCMLCGSLDNVGQIDGKDLCAACVSRIMGAVQRKKPA